MDLMLRGRTALITPAWIGLATAAVFADEGCNLVLLSRTAADLAAAKESVADSAITVTTHALDVCLSTSIDQLVAAHPDIEILVNNAGAIPAGRLDEVDEDVELMAQHQDLYLQRGARSEKSGQCAPDQSEPHHQPEDSSDSLSLVNRFRFSIGTRLGQLHSSWFRPSTRRVASLP
jgi:NAD(P)-dependent dehydrogenase (short-subunit alcohol dehydrogenase family)